MHSTPTATVVSASDRSTYPSRFFVSVTNPVGESCASNIVYIQGSVTGIPIGEPPDAVVSRRLFDVRGRLLRGPPRASGIYFERSVWRSGKIKVHRRVILH